MFYLAVGLVIAGLVLLLYGLLAPKTAQRPAGSDQNRPLWTRRTRMGSGAPLRPEPAGYERRAEEFLQRAPAFEMPVNTGRPQPSYSQNESRRPGPAYEMPAGREHGQVSYEDEPVAAQREPAPIYVQNSGALEAENRDRQPVIEQAAERPVSQVPPAQTPPAAAQQAAAPQPSRPPSVQVYQEPEVILQIKGTLFFDKSHELSYTGEPFSADRLDPAALQSLKRVDRATLSCRPEDFYFETGEASYRLRQRQLARVIFYPEAVVFIPREDSLPVSIFVTTEGEKLRSHLHTGSES